MAGADYKRCFICGNKAFYDANYDEHNDYSKCNVYAVCPECIKKGWTRVIIKNMNTLAQKKGDGK